MLLPPEFTSLLRESVGEGGAAAVLEALDGSPSVSVRMNPLKPLGQFPFPDAEPIPWSPYGWFLKDRPVFTLDPLFHAGCYYVQESSAMIVGHVFRQIPLEAGACVLDLCAAPGGKTTDIAASLRDAFGDNFTLLSNEVMKSRQAVLRSNIESWGDPRVGTVSRDPSAFGREAVFDVVVADVPCSGEGMFRKDPRAREEWNPGLPAFCAARSRRIIADVWPALRPGGWLLYSTCTFNHLENDDTVSWIASQLGADILHPPVPSPATPTSNGCLMLPGLVPGEGQYAALLRKRGDGSSPRRSNPFLLFNADVPAASDPLAGLPVCEVDRETALRYLHGDALRLPDGSPVGLVAIAYCGQKLGAAKNIGPRCNNLYPKGKRIRMSV